METIHDISHDFLIKELLYVVELEDDGGVEVVIEGNDTSHCKKMLLKPVIRLPTDLKPWRTLKNIFLHLNGSEKLQILETALSLKDINKMPIYNFLKKELDIYWSP